MPIRTRTLLILTAAALGAALQACGSSSRGPSKDAMIDVRNPELSFDERAAAVERAWRDTAGSPADRAAAKSALKDLAWDARTPTEVRSRVLDTLINDSDPDVAREGRATVRLMIPKESSRAMEAYLCKRAAEGGWIECTPALVRSYARVVPGVPDDQRGERVALTTLHPGREPEQIVFEMFIRPPAPEPDVSVPDWRERLRSEAWELLGRLDSEGTVRAALLTGSGGVGDEEPVVRALRRCRQELGCVPITGDELKWMISLASETSAENKAWWAEAAAGVRSVPAANARGLYLRHAEPIRWAAARHSEWLNASREDLLSELEKRLEHRDRRRRTIDANEFRQPISQNLRDWRDKMRWGDVLAVLVVDEALHAPAFGPAMFQQAEQDRRDTSTEYGGIAESLASPPRAFRVRPFMPRPGQRDGDQRFVASEDMIASSDRALFQYHFHVQRWRNDAYAGPSREDLAYAARSGRTCVVLTGINDETLNVDYYQPDGVILDLGDLTRGGP